MRLFKTVISKSSPQAMKEKKYSKEDLARIIRLQELRKLQLSRRMTKQKTAQDLGAVHAIDIDKKSEQNLLQLKNRLREGCSLTEAEQKLLSSQKDTHEILTAKEQLLFKTLITKQHILHHSTSTLLLKKILQAGKTLLDPQEAKRRGIKTQTATPSYGGVDQNVFFGFGTKKSSLPHFIRSGETDDYSTIQIDFNKLQTSHPNLLKGLWCSGHFSYYGGAQQSKMEFPAKKLGGTKFYCSYEPESSGDNPKPTKYLHFIRETGEVITQKLEMGDEIASGENFLPFFALSFIERLRSLGGHVRDYLLDHPHDIETIEAITEDLFPVHHFELHIPTKFRLDEKYIQIITPQKRKAITTAVYRAASSGDIAMLTKLKAQGCPLDGYMYEDLYIYDNSPPIGFPIIGALKSKNKKALEWLIDNGAHPDVFKNTQNKYSQFLTENQSHDTTATTVLIIKAVTEVGDIDLFNFLVSKGLDINCYHHSLLKLEVQQYGLRSAGAKNPFVNADASAKNSDWVFATVLEAVKKNGQLAILDKVMELSRYCREYPHRILEDVARIGDGKIFNHLVKKYPVKNYNRLFYLAVENSNFALLPILIKFVQFNEFKSDHPNQPENDRLNLREMAMTHLTTGKIEMGEWLLKQAGIKPNTLTDHELFGILDSFSNGDKNIDAKVRWILGSAQLHADKVLARPPRAITLLSKLYEINEHRYVTELIESRKADPFSQLFYSTDLNLEESPTPLALALQNEDFKFAEYLWQHPSNKFVNHHQKILSLAIKQNQRQVVAWLLGKKVSPLPSDLIELALNYGTPKLTPDLMKDILSRGGRLPSKPLQADLDQIVPIHEQLNFIKMNPNSHQLESLSTKIDNAEFKNVKAINIYKRLFENAILNNNVFMLDWLHKEYQFIPQLFQNHFADLFRYPDSINNERLAVVKWMLEHGINPMIPNNYGFTLFKSIITRQHPHQADVLALELLAQHGGLDREILNRFGTDALIRALQSFDQPNMRHYIDWLITHRTPMDQYSAVSLTVPLETACVTGDATLVKKLLEHKADPNFGFVNKGPLQYACEAKKPNLEIIKLLLEAGAKPNLECIIVLLKISPHSLNIIHFPLQIAIDCVNKELQKVILREIKQEEDFDTFCTSLISLVNPQTKLPVADGYKKLHGDLQILIQKHKELGNEAVKLIKQKIIVFTNMDQPNKKRILEIILKPQTNQTQPSGTTASKSYLNTKTLAGIGATIGFFATGGLGGIAAGAAMGLISKPIAESMASCCSRRGSRNK